MAALLVGCASGPKLPSLPAGRDGPAAEIPADLARIPDAEPRVEPIRPGGANKPYEVDGRRYTPESRDVPIKETGLASWYGRKFHGRKTASGELYNMHAMTAAHKTMPLPSYARVRNPANGREVIVRINDRGPFVAGRIIDLSYTAALKLDLLRGVAPVEIERLTFDQIRTGAWRRDGGATAAPTVAPTPPPVPTAAPAASRDLPADNPAAMSVAIPTVTSGSAAPPPAAPVVATSPPPVATAPIPDAQPVRALTAGARGYWVQLGAFRERRGAVSFQQRVGDELTWLSPLLAVFDDAPLYRLQAGPYASREEAQDAAQRVRDALQLVPVIVEKQ